MSFRETFNNAQRIVERLLAEDSVDSLISQLPGKRGTKDLGAITVEGYRVGNLDDLHSRGIYFSGDETGASHYASLHQGHAVKKYKISLQNALLAGHQNDVVQKFFNTTYGDFYDKHGVRAKDSVKGGRTADAQIARALKKAGYDGVIYVSPAPPAKTEIGIFNAGNAVELPVPARSDT